MSGNHLPSNKHKCIPLFLPNNYRWNSRTGNLTKISRVNRSHLVLCDDAASLLSGIAYPICIVAICGDRRTGKSYIISQLHEPSLEYCIFGVSDSMRANTIGIWMSGQPFLKTLENGQQVAIILVDTEGFDSIETMATHDDVIFTLTLLLSSVLIYNVTGNVKDTDLLKLRKVGQFAREIQGRSGKRVDGSNLADFFPNFMWLFRDMLLKPRRVKNGREVSVPIEEYLKEEVLKRNYSVNQRTYDNVTLATIGEDILRCFPVFKAFSLSFPSDDPDVLAELENPKNRSLIQPKFKREVTEFIAVLRRLFKAKKAWPLSKFMHGNEFVSVARTYLDSVQNGSIMTTVCTSAEQTVRKTLDEAFDNAAKSYDNMMGMLRLPRSERSLDRIHKMRCEETLKQFADDVSCVTQKQLISEYSANLKERLASYDGNGHVVGGLYHKYVRENDQQHCIDVANRLLTGKLHTLQAQNTTRNSVIAATIDSMKEEYDRMSRGNAAQQIKEDVLSKGVSEFYIDNVNWIWKTTGFQIPSISNINDRERFKARLRALKSEEALRQQELAKEELKRAKAEQERLLRKKMEEEERERERINARMVDTKLQEFMAGPEREIQSINKRYEEALQLHTERAKRAVLEQHTASLRGTAPSYTYNGQAFKQTLTELREQAHKLLGIHENCRCMCCGTDKIQDPRYECKVCPNYNLCENCFRCKASHSHAFQRIILKEPYPVYVGIPGVRHNIIHPTVMCDGCAEHPMNGNRYKCTVCDNFDICESCFKKKRDHSHGFNLITWPGATATAAGTPGGPVSPRAQCKAQ